MGKNDIRDLLKVTGGDGARVPVIPALVREVATGPQIEGAPASNAPAEANGLGAEQLLGALVRLDHSSRALSEIQAQTVRVFEENTRATAENTSSRLRDAGSALASTLGQGRNLPTAGAALSPVLTGLFRLFGRRENSPPPELPRFELPERISLDAALPAEGTPGLTPVSYDAAGQPRRVRAAADTAPQITIQVQTMDSRSFLDNSDQIARAVKEAMLNMHSLNDIVSEL